MMNSPEVGFDKQAARKYSAWIHESLPERRHGRNTRGESRALAVTLAEPSPYQLLISVLCCV